MDVAERVRARVAGLLGDFAARGVLAGEPDLARLAVAPCRDAANGDLTINAALAFGPAWRGPGHGARGLAAALAQDLARDADVARVTAARGFLTLALSRHALGAAAGAILGQGGLGLPAASGAAWLVRVAAPRDREGVTGALDGARAAVVADALRRFRSAVGDEAALAVEASGPSGSELLRSLGVASDRDRGSRAGSGACAVLTVVPRGGAQPEALGKAGSVVPVAACRLVPGPAGATPDAALVGHDAAALRFAMLCRPRPQPLELDPETAADRSHAGPLFDVRYAHMRAARLLRGFGPDTPPARAALARAGLSGLTAPAERDLLRALALLPHALRRAFAEHEPSRLTAGLRDLAAAVHRQWNASKDQPQLRFVNEERRDLTEARLGLMMASTIALKSGLGLFGITAPEELR